jgi:hypothetical protein
MRVVLGLGMRDRSQSDDRYSQDGFTQNATALTHLLFLIAPLWGDLWPKIEALPPRSMSSNGVASSLLFFPGPVCASRDDQRPSQHYNAPNDEISQG